MFHFNLSYEQFRARNSLSKLPCSALAEDDFLTFDILVPARTRERKQADQTTAQVAALFTIFPLGTTSVRSCTGGRNAESVDKNFKLLMLGFRGSLSHFDYLYLSKTEGAFCVIFY